jgi:hypothetical protein
MQVTREIQVPNHRTLSLSEVCLQRTPQQVTQPPLVCSDLYPAVLNHHLVRMNPLIEDPEDINPLINRQLIFSKGAQNTPWRKGSLFNKCCWENWVSTCRRLKLDPCLHPVPKSTQSGSKT